MSPHTMWNVFDWDIFKSCLYSGKGLCASHSAPLHTSYITLRTLCIPSHSTIHFWFFRCGNKLEIRNIFMAGFSFMHWIRDFSPNNFLAHPEKLQICFHCKYIQMLFWNRSLLSYTRPGLPDFSELRNKFFKDYVLVQSYRGTSSLRSPAEAAL